MKSKRITDRAFFTCSAEELAPKLLGKIICKKENDGFIIRCRINVTEAYPGDDPVNDAVRAARNGKETAQLKEGGIVYVKSTRGGFRFDIVAGEAGNGESVLIRGVDPYAEGPFIAAAALNIDETFDGVDLVSPDAPIWLEDDGAAAKSASPTQRVLGEKAPTESLEKRLRFAAKEMLISN